MTAPSGLIGQTGFSPDPEIFEGMLDNFGIGSFIRACCCFEPWRRAKIHFLSTASSGLNSLFRTDTKGYEGSGIVGMSRSIHNKNQ